MITSDYLEQIVDFDQPILVVGPGVRYFPCEELVEPLIKGKAAPLPPMDIALIWFAEKLIGRKGRVDVFDLPIEVPFGGSHNPKALKGYLEELTKRTSLGRINYLQGDIAEYNLPIFEYGLIWDHGTLNQWSHVNPHSGYDDRHKRSIRIMDNYLQGLDPEGLICLGTSDIDQGDQELLERMDRNNPHKVKLDKDAYRTTLNYKELGLGLTKTPPFLKGDLLFPQYQNTVILEIRKSPRRDKGDYGAFTLPVNSFSVQ
jgi:hypothetical protein